MDVDVGTGVGRAIEDSEDPNLRAFRFHIKPGVCTERAASSPFLEAFQLRTSTRKIIHRISLKSRKGRSYDL